MWLLADISFQLKIYRLMVGRRLISLLAGERPTKATSSRGSERKVPHIGTVTRSKLLLEAAVRNIWQRSRD